MRRLYPFPTLENADDLARHNGWTAEVYRDLLDLRSGRQSRAEFDAKYLHRKAILALDLTDFTVTCFDGRQAQALLRILDAHRVCVPVLREHDAWLIRAFADDLVALFDTAGSALDAAFEIQHRVALFNASNLATDHPAECCIGIGYGDVYAIGPNLAMGDEMNRASCLGEDTARGAETLVTENLYDALRHRPDVSFERITCESLPFTCFRASRAPTEDSRR